MKNLFYFLMTIMLLGNICYAQDNNVIEQELQGLLNQKSDEKIEINITFKSQIDSKDLKSKIRSTDKSLQREIVVSELKDFSQRNQADVMAILQAEELNGNVTDISALWIVNTISCKATRDVVYKLSSHPDILSIGCDKEIKMIDDKEVEIKEAAAVRGSAAPHILQVNADDVWAQGYTGKNVIVAVLDSGTNINHYDLKDHLWIGYADTDNDGEADDIIHGWNYVADNSDISDDFGHGTHCAGIVCGDGTIGNTVGVAPDATLMTVKIVNRAGGGSVTNMIKGVQFAIENGAQILSLSLGFKVDQVSVGIAAKESLRQTFVSALNSGVIVCAAAGNDGTTSGTLKNVDIPGACPPPWLHPDQKTIYEGGLSSVVCVGSVNSNNAHVSTSSEGPVTWQDIESYNDYPYDGSSTFGLIRPDISAPGELVYSLKYDENDKYKYMSGTSQATPCVAGVMALMLEKNSSLSPAQICEIIETTASNKPETKNNQIGSGVVDALAAVNACEAKNEKAFVKVTRYSPKVIVNSNNIGINITLNNQGKGRCENAVATLSTNDPYITIQEPSQNIDYIDANTEKTLSYNIDVNNAPNGHTVTMTLTTTDGVMTWTDEISLTTNSYEKIVYNSSNPGIIEAGKNVDLNVTVINKGTVATEYSSDIVLSTKSSFVTIENPVKTIETINAGEEKTVTYSVYVNPTIPDKTSLSFELQAIPNNYQNVKDITYEFEQSLDDYGYLDDGFDGWITYDANDDGRNHPWWHSSEHITHKVEDTGEAHSGDGQLMSETYCQASMQSYEKPIDNYLVSPKIKATANSKFSFYARVHDDYFGERFKVAVSENTNYTTSDFTTISSYSITRSAGNDWILYTVDLKDYADKEIYVAIRHNFTENEWEYVDSGYSTYILHIDDITFHNVIDCSNEFKNNNKSDFSISVESDPLPAPQNVEATLDGTNATTTVNLSWDAVTYAQSYNIYRNGNYVKNVAETSFIDTGLNPNTEYCYEVATVNNNYEYEHSETACVTTDRLDFNTNIKELSSEKIYPGDNTISITMINDGKNEHGSKTTVTLSTDDEYVTDISPATGVTMKSLDVDEEYLTDFSFTLDNNAPHNHVVEFKVKIEGSKVYDGTSWDNNCIWEIPFEVKVVNTLEMPYNFFANANDANTITLQWSAAYKAESYNIYRDGDLLANVTDNKYVDSDLYHNTEYCYTVTSVSGTEESEHSETLCIKTPQEANFIVCNSIDISSLIIGKENTIVATFTNEGFSEANNVTAVLSSENENIEIIDAEVIIEKIDANGGTNEVAFTIFAKTDLPENETVNFKVTTNCNVMTISDIPTYTFDNDFEGWMTVDRGGYGNNYTEHTWYHSSNSDSHSPNVNNFGSHSAPAHIMNATYCNKHSHTSKTVDDYVVAPEKITIGDDTEIRFWVTSTGKNIFKEKYGVVLTESWVNNGYGSTYNTIWSETIEKSGWQEKNIKISEYYPDAVGKEYYIGIRHYDCNGNNADGLCLDDVTISNVIKAKDINNESTFTMTTVVPTNNFIVNGLWNNPYNWSENSVPTENEKIIIEAAAVIDSDIVANSISISRGGNASLTINAGASLKVTELINSNDNALIIEDDAEIFINNGGVKASFKMNIVNPTEWKETKDGWQFIASPFTDANISTFVTTESDYDLYKYEGNNDDEWDNQYNDINFESVFQQGRGYLASYKTEQTATLSGTLYNGSSYTWNFTLSNKEFANFHLLGNPFPFNMDMNQAGFTGLVNGVAIVNEDGGYTYDATTIPVGDGFFVKVTGENASLSYGNATRGSKNEKANSLNIVATGKAGKDNVVINFAGVSEGFDKLQNFNEDIATVYVKEDGKRYGIYNCGADVQEVALSFNANQMGSYTIAAQPNGEFEMVTLVDRATGVETNLLLEDYTFAAMSNDNPDRFIIRFANGQQSTVDSHFVYQSGEELILNIQGEVQIVDVLGRVVYSGEAMNDINRINVSAFNSGAYMVKVINGNEVKVEKIIL